MDKKTCTKCEMEKDVTEFSKQEGGKFGVRSICKYCSRIIVSKNTKLHLKERMEYNKQYLADHPGYRAKLRSKKLSSGICPVCNGKLEKNKRMCKQCATEQNLRNKEHRDRLKKIVFEHYGNKCNCVTCDIVEQKFLSIDHIDNNGSKHKDKKGRRLSGEKLYRWIIKNNFPTNLQLLCMNCNFAKGHFGQCPHLEVIKVGD
jgi:hypothetical protein